MTDKLAAKRQAMVNEQLARRGIDNQRVLDAFARIERHRYVPAELHQLAYEDYPLAIGSAQTISQPYVVAYMLAALALQGTERVLEIGTGSGYQTALLAELAAEVYSIEFVLELAERANSSLKENSNQRVTIRVGDGRAGWSSAAPFDAVVCSAAPAAIPTPLLEQLAPGGRLIMPLGVEHQYLVLVRRVETGFSQRQLLPVRFVPLL
jgi:protein-L-isoaspartate(D-aspartate) O-methyltransferase